MGLPVNFTQPAELSGLMHAPPTHCPSTAHLHVRHAQQELAVLAGADQLEHLLWAGGCGVAGAAVKDIASSATQELVGLQQGTPVSGMMQCSGSEATPSCVASAAPSRWQAHLHRQRDDARLAGRAFHGVGLQGGQERDVRRMGSRMDGNHAMEGPAPICHQQSCMPTPAVLPLPPAAARRCSPCQRTSGRRQTQWS